MTPILAKDPPRWRGSLWVHAVGVWVLSLLLVACYLDPPGLGDDATYWRRADLAAHVGLDVFKASGFHTLRWPVWGPAFMVNKLGGSGLAAYYAGPFFYLPLGALAAFALTWYLTARPGAGWLASVLYLLHPLLNEVCHRPMPDLSEGLFIGAAFWLWFAWMRADALRARHWLMGVASGLFIGLAHSNRFTGLLAIPMLGLATLMLFPRQRWLRLLPIFGATAAFILAECAVYYSVTGDFWHSLHQNLGARGRKGTEPVSVFLLPFRFLKVLWKSARLEPFFLLAALGGAFLFWRRGTPAHRAAVWWWVLMYLAYSCALQSLFPPRPMLRDAGRFLSSLALPMSVLGATGVIALARHALKCLPTQWRMTGPLAQAAGVAGLLALLMVTTAREWTHSGYIPGIAAELRALPDQAVVISHDHFKAIARMVDREKADRLQWRDSIDILTPGNVKTAPEAVDAVYYSRKQMWLRRRKQLENKEEIPDRSLPWYFQQPWKKWTLAQVLLETGNSDFVFLRRRTPDDQPPQIWENALPPFMAEAGFQLPLKWRSEGAKQRISYELPVPEDWRGRKLWIQIDGSANHQQPLDSVKLVWKTADGKELLTQTEMPYFHKQDGHDFHALAIPADAAQVTVTFNLLPVAKRIEIDALTFYLQ